MEPFRIEARTEGGARTGVLDLPIAGPVATPLFMPVATHMSVKTLSSAELAATGTRAVITNGFLSSLHPGTDVIEGAGGMHRFMNWRGGIFSDSGGFQLIRKGFEPRIDEEGVTLRSPFGGERVSLTPEDVVDLHLKHRVDVGMVLDHCPPYPAGPGELKRSAIRTVEWARRSMGRLEEIGMEDAQAKSIAPLLFAITQGGTDQEFRKWCSSKLVEMDFSGYGIGGLSIGEDKEATFKALGWSIEMLPVDRPRYFMGVGDPNDVVRAVGLGADIFDSVFPTRNARHRSLFTGEGRENIRASKWRGSSRPIMEGCDCPACTDYSRGYIYHLFKTKESLGPRLATLHNVRYMQMLLDGIGRAIRGGWFSANSSPVDFL